MVSAPGLVPVPVPVPPGCCPVAPVPVPEPTVPGADGFRLGFSMDPRPLLSAAPGFGVGSDAAPAMQLFIVDA